jgi:hypothetical protein
MPFTSEQLTAGATYTLNTYERKDPIDQVNVKHVALDWLIKNKKDSLFGNGYHKEPLYIANGSNYQNYFGSDQVTYNERDPAKWAEFPHYNHHDGFWFDEDRLAANNIILTDNRNAMPSEAEKDQLINLLDTSYRALKEGIHEQLAFELYRDGSQSTKACPGFEHIIDWDTAAGTVGGIDQATFTWWKNNASTSVAADTNLLAGTQQMEVVWRNCMRYGGLMPTKLIAGSAFIDAYRKNSIAAVGRTINDGGAAKGGASIDPSISNLYFHGVPIEWDPTLDALDTLLSSTTRSKTCYFLNERAITLRPMKQHWMVNRKPERLPDRYVHYFGKTSKYGLTSAKRNALGILQIS